MRPGAVGCLATALMSLVGLSRIHAVAQTPAAASPSLSDLLARTAAYLEDYERKLPTVIAEEEYRQSGVGSVRTLHSDIMLVDLGNSEWVEFRDVFELNGQPVRDRTARLTALLAGPSSELLDKAQRIADESARYNIGIHRNINVPTMALTYLTRAHQSRSTFRLAGTASVRGTRATIVQFKETAAPPIIQATHGIVQTSGRCWLASDTGAVLRTELSVTIPPSADVPKDKSLDGKVTVDYKTDEHTALLVPDHMDEQYASPRGVSGLASYSHYQAFTVSVSGRGRGGQ